MTVAQLIGFFFVTWWAVGAGFGTFHKPFAVCSNGYFGAPLLSLSTPASTN